MVLQEVVQYEIWGVNGLMRMHGLTRNHDNQKDAHFKKL